MKLTKQTLKQIIKEELEAVMNEVNYAPEYPSQLTDDQIRKIHATIDRGDLEQAQAFIDAFEGDPDYVQKYIESSKHKLSLMLLRMATPTMFKNISNMVDRWSLKD